MRFLVFLNGSTARFFEFTDLVCGYVSCCLPTKLSRLVGPSPSDSVPLFYGQRSVESGRPHSRVGPQKFVTGTLAEPVEQPRV